MAAMLRAPRPLLSAFFLAVLCLSAVVAPAAARASTTWTEVRSPHFRIVTDSSPNTARHLAAQFEQMRHVFSTLFKRDDFESAAPLTVIAARDYGSLQTLVPTWKEDHVAGMFLHGWEREFAVVRLDTFEDQHQIVVFHEYAHSILHANIHWMPTWLDEGLAEFYGYTRFEKGRTLIGAPSVRLLHLRQSAFIPISDMLTMNPEAHFRGDPAQIDVFYGEAWAMVHYMIFGPGMEHKLTQFIALLDAQTPEKEAFQTVFGDPGAFGRKLAAYIDDVSLKVGVVPPDPHIDEKTFAVRALTPAEADVEAAELRTAFHDRKGTRAALDHALQLDPNLASAHEELGFLYFVEGQDAEARNEWERALAIDNTRPRSHFALTMTQKPLSAQTPAELAATQAELRAITSSTPGYAAAFAALAIAESLAGNQQQAYRDAQTARRLEPSRAGYTILEGRVLLRGNQPATAAKIARYVATHWTGPDRNEAVDLFFDVPPAFRGTDPAPAYDYPPDTTIVRGTLNALNCALQPKEHGSLTLTPAGPNGAPEEFFLALSFRTGFSDTFWWGEDHFSVCHHLTGFPAVIAVKPASGSIPAQVIDIESRDVPLPPPATTTASAAPPAQQGTASTAPSSH